MQPTRRANAILQIGRAGAFGGKVARTGQSADTPGHLDEEGLSKMHADVCQNLCATWLAGSGRRISDSRTLTPIPRPRLEVSPRSQPRGLGGERKMRRLVGSPLACRATSRWCLKCMCVAACELRLPVMWTLVRPPPISRAQCLHDADRNSISHKPAATFSGTFSRLRSLLVDPERAQLLMPSAGASLSCGGYLRVCWHPRIARATSSLPSRSPSAPLPHWSSSLLDGCGFALFLACMLGQLQCDETEYWTRRRGKTQSLLSFLFACDIQCKFRDLLVSPDKKG